jgi:hypothetical protein
MMNTGRRGVITDVLLVLNGGKETERMPFRAVTAAAITIAAITARTTIE